MKNILFNEKGATVVVVALAMITLIGFTALTIDGGYLYFKHTRLQDIADAVALASANQIGETQGGENLKKKKAFEKGLLYTEKNNILVTSPNNTTYTANIIYSGNEAGTLTMEFPNDLQLVKVNLKINAKNYFAKIFNSNSSAINVSATALLGQADTQTGGLVPVGIVGDNPDDESDDYIPGVQYNMTLSSGEGSSGNHGYLNFGQPSYFNDYLQSGYDGTLQVGDTVETKTGLDVGLVAKALELRIKDDTCTFDSYDEDCPRLIYTPIVDGYGESGSSTITIIGFAAFFLEDYIHQGNEITLVGRFVEMVSSEDIAPSNLGYTVQAVRLVD